jgi:hypothetical protein
MSSPSDFAFARRQPPEDAIRKLIGDPTEALLRVRAAAVRRGDEAPVSDPLAEFVQAGLVLSLLLREPEPASEDRLLPVLEAFVDAAVALEGHSLDLARIASNSVRGPTANPAARAAVAAMPARPVNHD